MRDTCNFVPTKYDRADQKAVETYSKLVRIIALDYPGVENYMSTLLLLLTRSTKDQVLVCFCAKDRSPVALHACTHVLVEVVPQ